MNSYLIDRQEPCVAELFRRLDKTAKTLDKLDVAIGDKRTFNGERFLTDKELSETLKISRRCLQEYRSSGRIPYYLVCGKIIYRESEIRKFLEEGRRRCLDEMELL